MYTPLGMYQRFVDNKWVAVLYIQILVDGKGLAGTYIQMERLAETGVEGRNTPPGGIPSDLLITNWLRLCIYKYWLMVKGLRGRIYKPNFSASLRHGRRRVGPAMEDFEISHPENRARLGVALLFASVSIIRSVSSRGTGRRSQCRAYGARDGCCLTSQPCRAGLRLADGPTGLSRRGAIWGRSGWATFGGRPYGPRAMVTRSVAPTALGMVVV